MPLIEPKRRRFGLFFLIINFGIKKKKKNWGSIVSETHEFIWDCYEFMYMFVCMYVNFVKLQSKRDRESLMNNQSKRKRTSSKREEDEEYSTVVVDDNNHYQPARSSRHWKVADKMIGVFVPRKAHSCKNLNLPNTLSFLVHNFVFEGKKKKKSFSKKSIQEFG